MAFWSARNRCVYTWLLALAGVASAQTSESVTFPGATATVRYPAIAQVSATLRKPDTPAAKMPAIVILHGSGGIDGRGAFYADALNKAGYATLEVFMFAQGERNREGHESTLTHAYGALNYLAARSDIDPARIAAMGFSWGGNVTLKLASQKVSDAFAAGTGANRFAALAAFYPVCWQHTRAAVNTAHETFGSYAAFTGAPVMLMASGKDDFGNPDDCQKFIEAVAPVAKGSIQLQFYPDATHAWDTPPGRSRTLYDPTAFQGKGGPVRVFSDTATAADSRARVLAFFDANLKGAKP